MLEKEPTMKAQRFAQPTKWIRSQQTGNTYVCPINVAPDASEEELRRRCVDESHNPQNS